MHRHSDAVHLLSLSLHRRYQWAAPWLQGDDAVIVDMNAPGALWPVWQHLLTTAPAAMQPALQRVWTAADHDCLRVYGAPGDNLSSEAVTGLLRHILTPAADLT